MLLVLCLALPILAVLGWSRLRPRPVALTVCTGLLLIAQLAASALTVAAINRSGDYYPTWSDLVGSFAKPAGIHHIGSGARGALMNGGPAPRAGTLTSRPQRGFSTSGQWARRGRLESITLTGANSDLTSRAVVYLPPQYFQAAYRHTVFPAAEVIAGYPGKARNLVHAMNYPGVLRSEVDGRRAKPMVLVMLAPSINYPRDTECTDVPAGPQALTFFGPDLTSAVSQHYRVLPTGWGAIGDSTGGYCSAKLAMTYPTTFPAAVSLSGYYHALKDHTTGDLWGGSTVVRDQNDLEWRLRHQAAPDVSLLVTISRDEAGRLGLGDTEKFIKLTKPPLRLDTNITLHGGHNLRAWSALLPQSMDWLSARLPAPEVLR